MSRKLIVDKQRLAISQLSKLKAVPQKFLLSYPNIS